MAKRMYLMVSRSMTISLVQASILLIGSVSWRKIAPPVRTFAFVALLFSIALPPSCFSQSHSDSPAYKKTVLAIQDRIQSGRLEEAHTLVDAASAKYPHDGGIENLRGVIEIEQGHTDAAVKAFSAAVSHSPQLAAAYLNLSRIKMATAATDRAARAEALRLSMKVLQLDPANDEAHYQVATILSWNKEYRASLQHLEKLSPESRIKIGAEALFCADHAGLGDRDKTTEAARALANNPDLTEQDADTCLANLRSARRADLIDSLFSAARTHQPLSPDGLRILGLAQEAEEKLPDARSTLESAFAAGTKNSVAILQDLARVAEAADDNQGALGYLAHARDLQPNNAALPFQFAVVCVRLGLLAEARKALAEALRLEPGNPDYNLAQGVVVSYSADPPQAIPYLARYRELRPKDPRGVLELGAANYRARDYDTATRWLRQAALNQKTAAEAHFYLGRIARQEGNLEAATSELKQVLALHPGHPDSLAELGQICIQKRDFGQASTYLNEALRTEPDNYAANFGLLELYARTSDPRRDQQSKRFEQVKAMKQEQEKDMMRVLEIRPNDQTEQRTPR